MFFQEKNFSQSVDHPKKQSWISNSLVISFLFVWGLSSFSQTKLNELGHYPVTNYSHKDSPGHYQNWFITQDKNGFIYAGNGNGVLEYDGVDWRLISAQGLSAVRTVVVDDNNVKWVGADRELGYLEPDSLGYLQFKSIKHKIPKSHLLTSNIWQIFPAKDKILFVTDNKIYCWKKDRFNVISHPGPGPIYREYQVHGEVYFNILGEGMFKTSGNSLQLIRQGELFKNKRVVVALPYGKDRILFLTKASGFFIYDGQSIKKLESEVADFLIENSLYAGKRLNDSIYALATLRDGVVLMGKDGKYIEKINVEDGILNNQVHGMAIDNQNSLWLALQTGISKVEPLSPFTIFDERLGLEGTVSAIVTHKNTLYVGTFEGLFKLQKNAIDNSIAFQRVKGIESGCFSLASLGNGLLAGTGDGVFSVTEKEVKQIRFIGGSRVLFQSKRDSNRVFIGHLHGLSTIYFKNGQWQPESDIDQIKEDIFSITTDDEGHLWLGTSLNQAIKIEWPKLEGEKQNLELDSIKIYRYKEGLPEGPTNLYFIDGALLMTSDGEGGPLFKLDRNSGKFISEVRFGDKFGLDSLLIYPIAYQNEGEHVLLESYSQTGPKYRYSARRDKNRHYSSQRVYDEPVRSNTQSRMFWDNRNILWSGGEGIARYDLSSTHDFKVEFNSFVRKVTIGQDSVIFGGNKDVYSYRPLNYSTKGLRFEYAAPNISPADALYQYRLVGLDSEWSNWTKETRKDYTNLPEGKYQFLVHAQNVYGNISKVDGFDFEILAPWYRTWGAYTLYLIFCIVFLSAILNWRSRWLQAKNATLEKLITARTSEVLHQANQLKIQAEKLQELDKAKSRFFANISHEFRTPLTLIKGPIEQLEQNYDEKLSMETVKMIRRSANRLLNMVNQLLNFSKIDEGNLKLAPTEGDVYKCLRAATSSFNSLAAQRNIDFIVQIPQLVLWSSFDRDKLENVLYNLLGNAFKFSENGADISFKAFYGENKLQIQVSDSGPGIPTEKLPFIFDRFYQVDGSSTKEKEGSGIGLSLSKDLIELMGGDITVSSKLNRGTFFTIKLPIQEIKTGQKKIDEIDLLLENSIEKRTYDQKKADQRGLPTILLIEDNSDMRYFIKEQLTKLYKVIEAPDGEAGLRISQSKTPDLIISDLMMPKIDGIELCKKLKTDVHTSHIPIIMLTAKAGIDNKIEGLETGADDYLTKPFDAKELLVRVKNLIEQRRKLRERYSDKKIQIDPKKITVTSIDQKFLEELISLLEENHASSDFNISQMQDALAMSKTQLHRKLKALTNEAPGEVLRNFRLKRAAQLLSQKADSVTQIAYRVGFNNLSYFAKCFKELYGVAPSQY